MTQQPNLNLEFEDDWEANVAATPEDEYAALLHGIQWSQEFNLLFVQCSPAEGARRIEQVRQDAPDKRIDVLTFTEPVENFYDAVKTLPNYEQLDVLFVQGIEHSLYDYEKHKLWDNSEDRYNYSNKGVPRLLGHLNLSRERFKNFEICFVFLVPRFALRYLIHRAPDFFDWHSGVFEFVMNEARLKSESFRIWMESVYEKYCLLSAQERQNKILSIQSLLEESKIPATEKANLLFEQGNLFVADKSYEGAIAAYDAALAVNPDFPEAL